MSQQMNTPPSPLPPCHWRRYTAYKPSDVEWLGEIPSGWDSKRLKFTVDLITEKVDATKSELPYLGLENIESWTGRYIPSEIPIETGGLTNYFRKGDVLLGKLRPYLAKILKATTDGVCTSELLVLHPKLVNRDFLFYYLISRDFIKTIDSSTYGAKMPRANWDFIGNLTSLIPPESEQTAIAAFLDRETTHIDALIEKKRQQIKLLQEKRAALISHVVTHGLDPSVPMKESGIEWLGMVPEEWEITKLGYESTVKARLGWKGLKADEYVDEGYIFLSTPDIKGDKIDFINSNHITAHRYFESPEIMLQTGDVLIVKDGSTLGITNIIRELPEPATVNSSIAVIRPRSSVSSVFLYYLLTSNYTQSTIQRMKGGQGVPHLFQEDLRKFWIWLPPFSEQEIIADFLDNKTKTIDALVEFIDNSIGELKEYRSALISAAVTGKIDVRLDVKA